MNTTRMIAWGFTDPDTADKRTRRNFIQTIRKEIQPLELHVGGQRGRPVYELFEPILVSGREAKRSAGYAVNLQEICQSALTIIDPDYRGGNDATR
jgi:hypothetical protein